MFQNIIGTYGTNLMSSRTLKSDITNELLLFLSFWNDLNCSQIYIIMKKIMNSESNNFCNQSYYTTSSYKQTHCFLNKHLNRQVWLHLSCLHVEINILYIGNILISHARDEEK